VEHIARIFSDPRKYGTEIVIKDIKQTKTNEDVNSFIIEFKSENSSLSKFVKILFLNEKNIFNFRYKFSSGLWIICLQ
jgi:hypothetical protein